MSKNERNVLLGVVHTAQPHDSARRHVTGEAIYVDDMPTPNGLVHVYFGLSERPHARLTAVNLGRVREAPGVVAVLTATDIPGQNDVSPTHKHD